MWGELVEPDRWKEGLDEDGRARVDELARALRGQSYSLVFKEWFGSGRSGSPVARVQRRKRRGHDDQVVLKFCPSADRADRLAEAWDERDSFCQQHLAETKEPALPLTGDGLVVFMHVGGDNLARYQALARLRESGDFHQRCGTVVRSVIADWNDESGIKLANRTVGQVVAAIVGRRAQDVGSWKPLRPLSDDPRSFLGGEDADLVLDVQIGKAHGDLSARNILLQGNPAPATDFWLIDYDHFTNEAPLANDPMHLLVALALDDFAEVRNRGSGYIDAIVNPYGPRSRRIGEFRDISLAIHEAVGSGLSVGSGLGDLVEPQCLVGLIGAALVHLGRKLHLEAGPLVSTQELEQEAKQWCFELAAAAATRLLSEHRHALSPARPADASPHSQQPQSSDDRSASQSGDPGVTTADLLGREDQHRRLRTRLAAGPFGMVMVRGRAGMGKTKLLDVTLQALQNGDVNERSVHIRKHLASRDRRLDVRTLIDLIGGESLPGTAAVSRSPLVRLEAVLDDLGGPPVVVAVDSAENLLDPRSRVLVDRDLDEAFAMLSDEPDRQIAIVLATQQDPVSPSAFGWPEVDEPIVVGRVELPPFLTFLRTRDYNGMLELDALPADQQRKLWQRLQGNPRLGELVCAIVCGSEVDLQAVVNGLPRGVEDAVASHITGLLIETVDEWRRDVLHAVAAFGTAVPCSAIAELLAGKWSLDQVTRAVKSLHRGQVLRRTGDGDVFLPPTDAEIILSRLPVTEGRRLRVRAATTLYGLRASAPQSVEDMRIPFAEVEALIAAGEFAAAHGVINEIDKVLQVWNCSYLLLRQRLAVRDDLEHSEDRLSNENAIAGIYYASGRLEEADEVYGSALKLAHQDGRASDAVALHNNLGLLNLAANRTGRAGIEFTYARQESLAAGDQAGHAGALEGLAYCHRRHGDYEGAVAQARAALDLPRVADDRRLTIILRMVRWYAELANFDAARTWLAAATQMATERNENALIAACLESEADLLLGANLDRDSVDKAVRLAHEAVDLALRLENASVLRRARTTLCVAHLQQGDFPEAARQIRRAYHYTRPQRPLGVLALMALTTRLTEPAAASAWFDRLLNTATERLKDDPENFSTRDFEAFARCGRLLERRDTLEAATEAISGNNQERIHAKARGITGRLEFLLRTLDGSGTPPGQLAPVIARLVDD
jgi:tetratricopeptide (TPR) repeat protein